jgi:TatD DNase family protein
MPAVIREQGENFNELILILDKLAAEGRIAAVGECGFDLYNDSYKETEQEQGRIFSAHIEIALKYGLPVVLHARRAMHKIFSFTKELAKCKAVIFHSWPGTLEEGESLLRRGVNAYFSFGNTIINGRKQSMYCCSLFHAERILTETDAPFLPARGAEFSCWQDLPRIIEAAAALRREAGSNLSDPRELEACIENNFKTIFTM